MADLSDSRLEALFRKHLGDRVADEAKARHRSEPQSSQLFWADVAELLIVIRRRCVVCNKISDPARLARHQINTGHAGWVNSPSRLE